MSDYQAFTNIFYDNCSLKKKEDENLQYFNRVADPEYVKTEYIKKPCFVDSPYSQTPSLSIPSSHVDKESDLRGQTRLLSKCPSQKFQQDLSEKMNELNNCESKFLEPEYTRVKKPCNIFSGITINRFDPVIEDFQSLNKIQDNSYIGKNTRLEIRDTFNKLNKSKQV